MNEQGLNFRAFNVNGDLVSADLLGVQEYSHEHIYGPYRASFVMREGEQGATADALQNIFETWLLNEIVTIWRGREVFGGLVWSMELTRGGIVRLNSAENMANRVCCSYRDQDEPYYTYWFENADSVERYGGLERIIKMEGNIGVAKDATGEGLTHPDYGWLYEPEWRVQTELNRWSRPKVLLDGVVSPGGESKTTGPAELRVELVGRQVAADRIYLNDGNISTSTQTWTPFGPLTGSLGSPALQDRGKHLRRTGDAVFDAMEWNEETTVGTEFRRVLAVIAYQGGWLFARDVAESGVIAYAGATRPMTAWQRLLELSSSAKPDYSEIDLTVDIDGGVNWRPRSESDPEMFVYPGTGQIVDGNREPISWGARPGLLRVVDRARSHFSGDGVTFVPRFSVGTDGVASPHPEERTLGDVYDAMREQESEAKRRGEL